MATKEALREAGPQLLEPLMAVEVVVPEAQVGAVIDDLNSRRGKISGITPRGNTQVIQAEVPLGNMFGYVSSLRSMTQGRATYTMQFHHYAPVPPSVAATVAQH
jgi:elongation factor G